MLQFFSGNSNVGRRELLRVFGLGSLLWPMSRIRAAAENRGTAAPGFGRAKSVILVYTNGGQSQLDTWDPKPDAPAEVRGEFAAIRTAVPGTLLSEHFPRLARLADRFTIIRSMSHEDVDHGSATYLALTGRYHARLSSNPPPSPEDAPTYGSVVKHVRPTTTFPYTAVHVNGPAFVPLFAGPGQSGGLLGGDTDPLLLGDVCHEPGGPVGLAPEPELPAIRLSARKTLLESIDQFRQARGRSGNIDDLQGRYEQAYRLLDSPRSRDAFDLTQEKHQLRRTLRPPPPRPGVLCSARRLVEVGIPWVTVFFNHNARGQDLDARVIPISTAGILTTTSSWR